MKSTYLLLNFFTIIIPLVRSAENRLRFYTRWKFLFPGMIFTAVFFLTWDYFKTRYGVWGFNDKYIIGPRFLGMPFEEFLFFFTVPYACVFIYEAISHFFDEKIKDGISRYFTWVLSAVSFAVSFFFFNKAYTFSVLFIGGLIFPVAAWMLKGNGLNKFYITYAISILPMLVVNGFLTALPVVIYNNNENLNFRIGTIPVEDFAYSAILLVMNIALYQWALNGKPLPFRQTESPASKYAGN